jgi:hypothetical protein
MDRCVSAAVDYREENEIIVVNVIGVFTGQIRGCEM